jgi:hypothetical protein
MYACAILFCGLFACVRDITNTSGERQHMRSLLECQLQQTDMAATGVTLQLP